MRIALFLMSVFAFLGPLSSSAEVPRPMPGSPKLLQFHPSDEADKATLRVYPEQRSSHQISPLLTGKFCEHLGSNIYKGMDAQIIRNPTFAPWPFSGGTRPDGGAKLESNEKAIAGQIRHMVRRVGRPSPESLMNARNQGLAFWWIKEGDEDKVRTSPDAGPFGGRAQRVEAARPGTGIAQWTYLPLHRTRQYEFTILVRSPDAVPLRVRLFAGDRTRAVSSAEIQGISDQWQTFTGTFSVPDSVPASSPVRISVTATRAGTLLINRFLLLPSDHVKGADPDVVRLLKESELPILRWPGGNFVSDYHWENGVGPPEERPTLSNPAWGGAEPNLFGTDEFVAFCRAVGCEPMICVNAGTGTPAEAAAWIEYCNGPPGSPGGRRRAANGHRKPFNIHYWEVGNELYGRGQAGWTTPQGYSDRYRRFAAAMLEADPAVHLIACGDAPLCVKPGNEWNTRLIRQNTATLQSISDHVLIGGQIPSSRDPMEVFRDFMFVPDLCERGYRKLEKQMLAAGIDAPRLAITEMQLFGRIKPTGRRGRPRLTFQNLVQPATQTEALYLTLFYHLAARLSPFLEMITHSATVNHGGGLRKERERVYANPCYYARKMFAAFLRAVPVMVELTGPGQTAAGTLAAIHNGPLADAAQPVLDPLAAITEDGSLLISIVNRGSQSPIETLVELPPDKFGPGAEITTLAAKTPWSKNTLEVPEAITPASHQEKTVRGRFTIQLPPYSVTRMRIPGK